MDTKIVAMFVVAGVSVFATLLTVLLVNQSTSVLRYEHQARQHQKCLDANERIAMLQLEQGRNSIVARESVRCPEIR